MSKKNKKMFRLFSYIEYLLILVSTVIGCISICVFPSLGCIPIEIASSAIGLKLCAITVGIKNINQRKRKEA